MGEVPLLRFMLYRLVKVQKSLNLLLVVQMVGNGAKAVILGDGGKIVLSMTTLYKVVPTRIYSSSFIGLD